MSLRHLRYDVSATGVATIALDQPDTRNALSDELLGDLLAALEAAREDRRRPLRGAHLHPREGVLQRRQPRWIRGGGAAGPQALRHRALSRACSGLLGELGKPTICAANGHVLAGALGVALACDLVIAREGARFGTPEINVGLFPFMIMALIYRNVPRKKVNEMLLLGEQMSAEEAERIGIVNRVVPAEDFDDTVRDWAEKLAQKSPVMMRAGQGRDVPPAGHGLHPGP